MRNTKKMTQTSLFAALVCVSTMIIKIPIPVTNGYIHFGDAFVTLSGIFLGPVYGALAGGLGSALADVISGYAIYAIPTLFIKALMAGGIGYIYPKLCTKVKHTTMNYILCGIYATSILVSGYFIFEKFMYGNAAFISIPANILQGISGIIISTVLHPFIEKIWKFNDISSKQ